MPFVGLGPMIHMEGILVIFFLTMSLHCLMPFVGLGSLIHMEGVLVIIIPNKGPELSYAYCGTWTLDPYGGSLGYFFS